MFQQKTPTFRSPTRRREITDGQCRNLIKPTILSATLATRVWINKQCLQKSLNTCLPRLNGGENNRGCAGETGENGKVVAVGVAAVGAVAGSAARRRRDAGCRWRHDQCVSVCLCAGRVGLWGARGGRITRDQRGECIRGGCLLCVRISIYPILFLSAEQRKWKSAMI